MYHAYAIPRSDRDQRMSCLNNILSLLALMDTKIQACVHVHVYMCMYERLHLCIHICMFAYIYACMYICMQYMYVYA